MSIIATAVKHLMAAGVTGDALIAAIADMEANMTSAVDVVAEKRRAYDRERKRAQKNSGGIPVESTEIAETTPFPAPPNENNLTPPTHTPGTKTRARKEPEIPIPDDWQPKQFGAGTICRGIVDGWPPGELEFQAEKFAAHHRKTQARWADWQAVWKTWVLNSRDFKNGKQGNGNSGNQQSDNMGRTERAAMQALRDLGLAPAEAGRSEGTGGSLPPARSHADVGRQSGAVLAIGHERGGQGGVVEGRANDDW